MKVILGTMNFGPQRDAGASREMVGAVLAAGYPVDVYCQQNFST